MPDMHKQLSLQAKSMSNNPCNVCPAHTIKTKTMIEMNQPTLGESIVLYAARGECVGLQYHLNQVDDLINSLSQALDVAAQENNVECVRAIVDSTIFNMLPKSQKNGILSSVSNASSNIRKLLESKKSSIGRKSRTNRK